MSNEPTGTRLERISPPPLTYQVWTRTSSEVRGHPVEVGIPTMQEAFRRLAAYGGPEYFEIRESNGNLVYEAAREEASHYHFHQQRVHAAPMPPPPLPKSEGNPWWIIFGIIGAVLFAILVAGANSGSSGTDMEVATEAASEALDAETIQDNMNEALLRGQLHDQYKQNAIDFMEMRDDSEGVYFLSDAVEGRICSGPKVWLFSHPSGTAPMEDGLAVNGRFIYVDMIGGKASRGLFKWNGNRLATKTVVAGDFDPATTNINDTALWDPTSSFYREVVEEWQGLPLQHVDTAAHRPTYDQFVIGQKSYLLCRINP